MARTAKVSIKGVVDHSTRKHALLSASGASRWLHCPPSAVLAEQFGEDKTSVFAEEGTLAHEISELFLRRDALESISEQEFEAKFEEYMNNPLFSEEMTNVLPIYTDYCREQYVSAKTTNGSAFMEIEQKLDLTEYVPEGFGTADCTVISNGVMEVIDLKYGKGIAVYATWNPQLMLYGLGAYLQYNMVYDIETVKVTIVQPRLNNISSWEISVKDLMDWADNVLKPGAQQAFKGEGEFAVGDWCRFCPVKARCRKFAEDNASVAKHEFCNPNLLTDEEFLQVMAQAPRIAEWTKAVADYAQAQAIDHGKNWPGYKVVEGRSIRKWAVSEEEVSAAIQENFPELNPEQYTETKLLSLGKVEKLVGKKEFTKLKDVVVKPQGAPTLVSVEDPRPEMNLVSAKEEFEESMN